MNLQQSILARRYAQAYMHVMGELSEHTIAQLTALLAFYGAHKKSFFYLDLSSFPAQTKAEIFLKVCDRYALRTPLHRLVMILARHGRLGLALQVVKMMIDLYNEQHNRVTVVMTSAQPVAAQEQQIIKTFLREQTGKDITISQKIDPRLIAGVRLQSDTFLWEHSIAKQLRALAAYAGTCAERYTR